MTDLGQFLRQLRESFHRYPVLTEEHLQSLTLEQIIAERTKRRYVFPRLKKLTKKAIIDLFLDAQAKDPPPTINYIATRAGIHASLLSKLENNVTGKGRATTLKRILEQGYGIYPSDPRYGDVMALWAKRHEGVDSVPDIAASLLAAGGFGQPQFENFLKRIIPHLATIPQSEYSDIEAFLQSQPLRSLIPGLLKAVKNAN